MTGQQPAAAMLFREASIQGRLVNLRAADDLGRYVQPDLGPAARRVCVPSHCEVLRLEGQGPDPVDEGTAPDRGRPRGAEAGRAVRPVRPARRRRPNRSRAPIRYHTPQPSPVVIANGVAGLSRTTELETFYRSYAWFVPLGRGDVHPWAVGAFTRRRCSG